MNPRGIVLLQSDARAEALALALSPHFRVVIAAHSVTELREIIVKQQVQAAIVDLEVVDLAEVDRLNHDFGNVCIVCTHRAADDELWRKVLNAGAEDLCLSDDTQGIVAAVTRSAPMFRTAVA